jgi:catechol 2,3-dioxygenase-like lactoylglutathione lyase family enzyme
MRQVKIVSLLVKDYDAAIQFYTQKLGFQVAEDAAFGDPTMGHVVGRAACGQLGCGAPRGAGVPGSVGSLPSETPTEALSTRHRLTSTGCLRSRFHAGSRLPVCQSAFRSVALTSQSLQ